MRRSLVAVLLIVLSALPALAATLHVPQDHKTERAAIDAGDFYDNSDIDFAISLKWTWTLKALPKGTWPAPSP